MLNPFPIQFLAMLAYTLLRIVVGGVLIFLGVRHLKNREVLAERFSFIHLPFGNFFAWYVSFFEVLIGSLFVFGLATQIAALLAMLLSLKFMYLSHFFGCLFLGVRSHFLSPELVLLLLISHSRPT
jgi:uncharacterized membrane protein YphA (DoxX/SURF4 family)